MLSYYLHCINHDDRLVLSCLIGYVSVSVHILANHASAHGGLSANVLSDICLSFFELILPFFLKLCLMVAVIGKKICPNAGVGRMV